MDGYLPMISLRAIRGYDLRPVPEDVLTRILLSQIGFRPLASLRTAARSSVTPRCAGLRGRGAVVSESAHSERSGQSDAISRLQESAHGEGRSAIRAHGGSE